MAVTKPSRARLQPANPVRQKATLVYAPHPLLADAGRVVTQTVAIQGESIGQYLRRHGVDTTAPLVVTVDSREVGRTDWELLPAEQGQLVTARGGLAGGGGGSNPLRLVAMIALAVAAPFAAGAMLGTTAGAFAATALGGVPTFLAVAGGVVTVAGSLLLNKLFPPPKMDLGKGMSDYKASPTYSIAGGQNRARPYEPLPLVLGTHRAFFDLAGKPYTVFQGDEQYLYQVFCIGMIGPHGALDVSDLRIGETLLSSYAEVTTEMSVGVLPTLMPANVDTVAGAQITQSGGSVTRTTSADTTRIEVDFVAVSFSANTSDGRIVNHALTFSIDYRPAGSAAAWTTLASVTTMGNQTAPVRLTYGAAVTAGTYDVRVTRSTPDSTDERITTDLQWSALKSYQADDGFYEGQQFLAVKIRATGQLQGVIERLSGLVRMPTAPGEYSSNPADIFRLFAVGHKAADGRPLWGGQLSPSALDVAGLDAWRTWGATKGLAFNGVIDAQRSVWDVLQGISRCGRGSPTWASGKLGVVWDADNQPVVASFSMSNIVRDTFQVAYQSEDPVDEVVLSYVDAAAGYQPDQVRALAPGITVPTKSASIELWGCTAQAQAVKECYLALAENLYGTRLVSWETDMEGLVVTRGDVVSLSHDLTQWGVSGRLLSGTKTQVTLDRNIDVVFGATWIGIVSPDGDQRICRVGGVSGQRSTITLLDALPSAPNDDNPIDWRYTADYLATPGKLVKIVSVVPTGMHSVRLAAVDEYDEYYESENGTYTPPTRRRWASSQPQIRALGVTEEVVRSGDSYTTRLVVTWTESGDVVTRQVRYSMDGGPLQVAGRPDAARYELIVGDVGTVLIVVTLYDKLGQTSSAAQASLSHTLAGVAYGPAELLSLTASTELFQIRLSWMFDGDQLAVKHVELWASMSNNRNAAALLSTISSPTNGFLHTGLHPGDTRYYWARVVDNKNRPSDWFPAGITDGVQGMASADPSDILAALTGSITEDALYQDLAARIDLVDDPTDGAITKIAGLQSQVNSLVSEVADLGATPDYDPLEPYITGDIVKYDGGLYKALGATTGNLPSNATYWQKIGDYASIGDAVAGLAVDVSSLDTRVGATETGLSSEVAARRLLAATLTGFNDPSGKTIDQLSTGIIAEEKNARAAQDGVLALQISTVYAAAARSRTYRQTSAPTTGMSTGDLWFDSDENNKPYRYSGSAWVATDDTRIAINAAAIVSEQTARANADTSIAESVTTLSSTVGGHTISIQASASTINGINAKYTIKVDNNGYMSGYGLISTANNGTPTSAFTVLADKFQVVMPGLAAKVPFIVGQVNGVSTVGVNGALVVDGSILARSINTNGLTVRDNAGNIILSSGVPLDWARINGRPPDLIGVHNPITANNATTYVANGAFGNAQIGGDLWSTNWSGWGGNGWLLSRSGSMYLNNVYARGDIEASRLKAGAAMVETLHIKGNAVTTTVHAYTAASTGNLVPSGWGVWVTVQSAYCNPEGGQVSVIGSAAITGASPGGFVAKLRIVSPSGASAESEGFVFQMNDGREPISSDFWVPANLVAVGAAAEAGVYLLQVNANAWHSVKNRSLLLMGSKR